MEILWLLLWVFVVGLIIGALGRLIVPGPDPIGLLGTAGAGIGGALLGALLAREVLETSRGWEFVLSVLCAAAIVYLVRLANRPRVVG